MKRRALILSDVHLSAEKGFSTAKSLTDLVVSHPESDLILNGDIFDLSLYSYSDGLRKWLTAILSAHPALTDALRSHLERGRSIHFIAGNHDAWLSHAEASTHLRALLTPPSPEQLQVHPWFFRVGDVHIEHGHLYDRDNSFPHPLGGFDPRTEPLGTALMRRFVAPNEAYFFAHAHRTTPAGGLLLTLKTWKWRAPVVILNYFVAAAGLVLDAGFRKSLVRAQIKTGTEALPATARERGLNVSLLKAVAEKATLPPRNMSARETFMRLYFDRVLAALGGFGGAVALLFCIALKLTGHASLSPALVASLVSLTALCWGYLLVDVRRRKNRYGGSIVEDIGAQARLVRSILGAKTVVLGHTHVAVAEDGYVNLGSFGYGHPRRSFAWLAEDGTVHLDEVPR